jgi:hypothetical protein
MRKPHLVIMLYVLCWCYSASYAHQQSLDSLDLFVDRSPLRSHHLSMKSRIEQEAYYRCVVRIVVEKDGMAEWELKLRLPSAQDRIVKQGDKYMVSNGAEVVGYFGDKDFRKSYYNSSELADRMNPTDTWDYVLGPVEWTEKVHEGGRLFIEFIATNKYRLSAEGIRNGLQIQLNSKAGAPIQFHNNS